MTNPDGSEGRDSSSHRHRHRHQSSPPPDPGLFDFFSGGRSAASEMCAAGDIFLRGKLLPFSAPPPPPPKRCETHMPNHRPKDHRRADSLDRLDRRHGCCADRLAAEHRKLRRVPESDQRAPAQRSRPRWYLFVFGSVKVPAEMEMRDIRSRQGRRIPSAVAPKSVMGSVGWGGEAGWGPWKLLQSLSCKGVESAFAAAPMSYV